MRINEKERKREKEKRKNERMRKREREEERQRCRVGTWIKREIKSAGRGQGLEKLPGPPRANQPDRSYLVACKTQARLQCRYNNVLKNPCKPSDPSRPALLSQAAGEHHL